MKKKITDLSVSIDRLVDVYRQHPNMRQVELFKEQLKQQKQKDRIFCQSIKAKLTTF